MDGRDDLHDRARGRSRHIDTSDRAAGHGGRAWDPSQVIQIGVQITSGTMTADGGTLPTGPLVFEIDTVQAR